MTIFSAWLEATRPKTLPAALIPVFIGSAIAWKYHSFHFDVFLMASICALLIQIGTNFANDYFDFKKGADTDERIGFKRASSSGLIKPELMLRATILTMLTAFICGLYLVYIGGWIILAIGLASLAFGILYTGGPYPLAYNGLGDIFVFIFFGIVAVTGTFYAHTGTFNWEVFFASFVPGALSTNILVINNLRDTETDRKANKRTLGVIFGDNFLKIEFVLLCITAIAIPSHLLFWNRYNYYIFLPLLSLPFCFMLIKKLYSFTNKSELNHLLAKTAQFLILFGLLFTIGILVQK
jgi:1,4-dihydroxy-2-naphthoate polyprenyltransferase